MRGEIFSIEQLEWVETQRHAALVADREHDSILESFEKRKLAVLGFCGLYHKEIHSGGAQQLLAGHRLSGAGYACHENMLVQHIAIQQNRIVSKGLTSIHQMTD